MTYTSKHRVPGIILAKNLATRGTANEPSAAFQVNDVDTGILTSRITTAQRNAIASPATGLVVYNTDTKRLEVWNGTAWSAGGNGRVIDVRDYNAVPDARVVLDLQATTGLPTVTSASANFTSADIGKVIKFYDTSIDAYGATTTIQSVTNATTAVMVGNSPITITSTHVGYCMIGTDQSANIQAALNAALALTGQNPTSLSSAVNFPSGIGQVTVLLPVDTTGDAYLIANPITAFRNTCINADAMILCALPGTGINDRTFPIILKSGVSIDRLRVHAGWGMGVLAGDPFANCDSFVNDLQVFNGGTNNNNSLNPTNQTSVQIRGNTWSINSIYADCHGNGTGGTCVDIESGVDINIGRITAIGGKFGLLVLGVEELMVSKLLCNTIKNSPIRINSCNNVDIDAMSYVDFDDSAGTIAQVAGVLVGDFTTVVNNNIRIRYQASSTGGALAILSNIANSTLFLQGSNARQLSNTTGVKQITNGVAYLTGVSNSLMVHMVLDATITSVFSGTVTGELDVLQGGTRTMYGSGVRVLAQKSVTVTDGSVNEPVPGAIGAFVGGSLPFFKEVDQFAISDNVDMFRYVLTGDATIMLPTRTNVTAGSNVVTVSVSQDVVGGRKLSFVGQAPGVILEGFVGTMPLIGQPGDIVKWDGAYGTNNMPPMVGTASSETVYEFRCYQGDLVWRGRRLFTDPLSVAVGYYTAGDIVYAQAPAAASNIGSVCVTSGLANAAAWATGTVYTKGQRVTANGNVYQALVNGTSLGSGTGPSGTGQNIVDNTVRWTFLSVAAVFKTFGTIAA